MLGYLFRWPSTNSPTIKVGSLSIQASCVRRPAMITPSVCEDDHWRLSTSNFDEACYAFWTADDKMDAIVQFNDSLRRMHQHPRGRLFHASPRPRFVTFNNAITRTASPRSHHGLEHRIRARRRYRFAIRLKLPMQREIRLKSYQHTARVNGRKASMQGTQSQDCRIVPNDKMSMLASKLPSSSSSSAPSTGVET